MTSYFLRFLPVPLLLYHLLVANPVLADQDTANLAPGDRVRLKAPAYWEINPAPFVLTGYRAYRAHPRTAWLYGSIEHLTADTLILRETRHGRRLSLPLPLITHFGQSRGRGHHTATGAWIGAGAGLLLGGLSGAQSDTDNCLGAACGLVNSALLGTALAIPGGLLGTALGHMLSWEIWQPGRLHPQRWRPSRPPPPPSPATLSANQFSIETTALLNWSLGYARRLSPSFHSGARFGFAWEENFHAFDRHIWNVADATLFVRYQQGPFFQQGPLVQLETGGTLFAYSPQDDEDEYGDFTGLYGAVLVGHDSFYLGTRLRWGRATDDDGPEWGFLYNPLVIRLAWPR